MSSPAWVPVFLTWTVAVMSAMSRIWSTFLSSVTRPSRGSPSAADLSPHRSAAQSAHLGVRQRDEVGRRELDLEAAAARRHEDRVVLEGGVVDERRERPALAERADPAGDVAGRARRLRGVREARALAQ